jgi:hypothetical protein
MKLAQALLLYTVRSERQLMEQLETSIYRVLRGV